MYWWCDLNMSKCKNKYVTKFQHASELTTAGNYLWEFKNASDFMSLWAFVGSKMLLLPSSQGTAFLLLLQPAKVIFRLTNGWHLLTDWRCFVLFLECQHQQTSLPLWTNEFYLSGYVFQRRRSWSEEVNVGKYLCPEIGINALQPSFRQWLFSGVLCLYIFI